MAKTAVITTPPLQMCPEEQELLEALLRARPDLHGSVKAVQVISMSDLPTKALSNWGHRNADRMGFCPTYQQLRNHWVCVDYLGWTLKQEELSLGDAPPYLGYALVAVGFARDKTLLGVCEVGDTNRARKAAKISYAADASIEGTGLMGRFVAECINRAKMAGIRRITAEIAEGNARSAGLAAKLGFQHEGVMRQGEVLDGQPVDLHIWGLV